MWSTLSKIFTRKSSGGASHGDGEDEAPPPQPTCEMDRPVGLSGSGGVSASMDGSHQAKQRASMKWVLSKAFNNKVPDSLKEPFYRDHENQEHLKPQILGGLANAEIYCLALGNIYTDPNYHNLNHWAILQTLSRKGVFVAEPSDAQLTETVLLQTNPLRMSAHMAVIESIMLLYAREVVSPDRVVAAVQRFSHGRDQAPTLPESHEEGLLLWVNHACNALQKRIEQELKEDSSQGEARLKKLEFPNVRHLKDLCDGVGLAALISYYCPEELPWTDLRVSPLGSLQDSLYNLRLVQEFCHRCLPASIFHLMPEDVANMRDSMRQNLAVFLADLFNVLELHPVECVHFPGMEKFNNVSRSTNNHLPLRKTASLQQSVSEMSEDSLRRGSDDSFAVHRSQKIPTLRSVINVSEEPLVPARLKPNKEKQNSDSKADERGEMAAGKPSNWEENRKSSFAGRRSRRNSTSDDSQLTIENFGGSQDNLNFLGRNPDKEVAVHVGRKLSTPTFPVAIENPAVRSSIQDARGSFQLGYDNGCEKDDSGSEKIGKLKRQLSSEDVFRPLNSTTKETLIKDLVDGELSSKMSFADLNKKLLGEQTGIQLVYMNDKEEFNQTPPKSSFLKTTNGEKKTTFAALPNTTTTWQQQSSTNNQQNNETNGEDLSPSNGMNAQLSDIRLKLEEKRRHIESEKRRMEVAMSKQRQKVGKAAFLQAVAKEINEDASTVERKWLDESNPPFVETRRTPDLDNMGLEEYQQSIAQMNSSLHDIQSDIQRLASQQSQIQAAQQQNLIVQQQQRHLQALQQQQQHYHQLYSYGAPPLQSSASAPHLPQTLYGNTPQFFLHDQSQAPTPPIRRTWAQAPLETPLYGVSPPLHQSELRTWGGVKKAASPAPSSGFVLHESPDSRLFADNKYQQNGGEDRTLHHSNSFTLSQQHLQQQQQHYGTSHSTPSASPQHRSVHRQISALLDDGKRSLNNSPVSLHQIDTPPALPPRKSSTIHTPIPAPPVDDMEPQNISFIGSNEDQVINEGISRLNITSGSRTYRIPSPTRPLLAARNAFQPPHIPAPPEQHEQTPTAAEISSLDNDPTNQKGFYITFDNDQPKRPKPPLRTKRGSPKKERSYVETPEETILRREEQERAEKRRQMERELEEEKLRRDEQDKRMQQRVMMERREASQERQKVAAASTIIIGNELKNPDPDLLDERERKKEKIMLLSLQRRQQQEEAKARKEAEAQARREKDKLKEEERARKKEEQAAKRAAILEQYKLKKAIEEAEREGKVLDKSELMSLKPAPKMRAKASMRPRPKTIHIDSGSVQLAEGMSSRGKKGSTSNLTGSSTDQDSLAYRFGDTDSGLGRATPPRRAPSPGMGSMRHLPSPSGPGSLPGLMSKGRRIFDDGSSDISSTPSSMMDYNGPRLYKQPAAKSNRSIMLNAVEYCVFPGVVNRDAKKRVLDEINRSESKHFLILFRDSKCQFRALYSYCPDREEVSKLYGTGPKQVNDEMFDKFFKYNSGGKCFSQVHTKHLTVTIDAFTIQNSLWQGKKMNLHSKKDMALVI